MIAAMTLFYICAFGAAGLLAVQRRPAMLLLRVPQSTYQPRRG